VLRTYKYRIYPNKTEEKNLLSTLEICRRTYNGLLNLRKNTWEIEKISISQFSCNKVICGWKKDDDKYFLNSVYSQVLQNVSDRVDKAYQNFFRRVKSGEIPGFPRFKGLGQYNSFTYPQKGFNLFTDDSGKIFLKLSKIGNIKVILHREINGKIKTCTIRKTLSNKWYVTFSCELPDVEQVSKINNPIGIDCGLNNFVTLSNGQKVDTQRFFRIGEEKLEKLDYNLSISRSESFERKENKKRLILAHEKIANRRSNFSHHISRWLVNNFDYIVFEDLDINKMIKNHKLAKSIQDAVWNQLIQYTQYKAENAGTWVKLVNPAYTSQTCSNCGNIKKKSLGERWHNCDCGLSIDRDENAAINILRLGIQSLEASNP